MADININFAHTGSRYKIYEDDICPSNTGQHERVKDDLHDQATSRIIDGSYNSIYKGRSMNFDELREYVVGDDIKDVDWKASARSQKVLIRQYIAEKKHNIMLVMDTNRRMLANANETQEKKDIALMAAGTLACMVSANGDYVSATYSDASSIQHFPFKTGLINVENIMAAYDGIHQWTMDQSWALRLSSYPEI